jgi:NAD-dependent deacetylase
MQESLFSTSLLSLIKRSRSIMISTGAGISAESGAPTFRSDNGLWNKFKPEELATPAAFQKDPKKVWEWYDWRRQNYRKIRPNQGHLALAEMETLLPQLRLFTQNVDGLHQRAGHRKVYELHGNIWNARCTKERKRLELSETPLQKIPPVCECGALLRPDVVWFGESIPPELLELAFQTASKSEVFFSIGTSGTVQPAASLGWIAKENGAIVIEINPERTPVTDIADEVFQEKGGVVLPDLLHALQKTS